jgi:dimethylglycine dehydrogenase
LVGHSCLTPLLGVRGGIAGDFTVTKLSDDEFFMVGSGMAERYHKRYFSSVDMPANTTFESQTTAMCGFNIAGPKSRELLARLTQEDLSNESWKFMRSRKITVAGIAATALRVSFTGDLGWELYVAESDQEKLWDALLANGADLGVCPVGSRSLGHLRIEKGYGSWGREYSPEYWPQEVGLARLIKMDKPEFLGREAYVKNAEKPPREVLVSLVVDAIDADASGGEPVFLPDGSPVGRVSSGAYGFSVGKSIALCFIKTEHAKAGAVFDIAILGKPHKAVQLAEPAFDPKGLRMRG